MMRDIAIDALHVGMNGALQGGSDLFSSLMREGVDDFGKRFQRYGTTNQQVTPILYRDTMSVIRDIEQIAI